MADLLSRVSWVCAIQLGAGGYADGWTIFRRVRDAQALAVFAGSSETMRETFAAPFFAERMRSARLSR